MFVWMLLIVVNPKNNFYTLFLVLFLRPALLHHLGKFFFSPHTPLQTPWLGPHGLLAACPYPLLASQQVRAQPQAAHSHQKNGVAALSAHCCQGQQWLILAFFNPLGMGRV